MRCNFRPFLKNNTRRDFEKKKKERFKKDRKCLIFRRSAGPDIPPLGEKKKSGRSNSQRPSPNV